MICQGALGKILSLFLVLCSLLGAQGFSVRSRTIRSLRRSPSGGRILRMDDEISRAGQKEEFTTLEDEYYDRFVGLSKSGHDLTPLPDEEIDHILTAQKELLEDDHASSSSYPGEGKKGLYCARIGGLPLFSSGCRVDHACTKEVLVFDELADEDHAVMRPGLESKVLLDVRCFKKVALERDGLFYVKHSAVIFHELNTPLPLASQPVNFWGTEGQYTLRQDIDGTGPLSY